MPAPRFVLDEFWPSDLFLGGIPGAWYDPTDLSTMFQDSAGTTPVTAVEQPVGLVLDKSQGLLVSTMTGFLPGSSGSAYSTPNAAALNVTGDIDLRVQVALNDWTPGTRAALYGKDNQYNFLVDTAGTLSFWGYPGGVFTARTSSVATGIADGTVQWVRVTNSAAGCIFYTSADGVTWTQLGTAQAQVAGVLATTAAALIVGGRGGGGVAENVAGRVFRAQLYSGVGGTLVSDFNVTSYTSGATFVAPTGETWTILGSASIKPAGNHASQSTAASRPTYRARYNLLEYSEDFGNAAWQKNDGATVTTDAVLAPDGTLTADALNIGALNISRVQQPLWALTTATMNYSVWMRVASGTEQIRFGDAAALTTVTVTSVWQRFVVVVNITGTVTNLTIRNDVAGGAKTIYAWGAQLLTAADVTATGNAYQRIAAATVYDTAPIFRPYLAFDGLDDSLSTSAINFTSTDKMTVFAGLSKLSDATALIAEISTTVNTNAGSFGIGVNAGPNYFSALNGSALAFYTQTTFTAPATSVLTTRYNIGGATIADEIIPRVNATTPTLAGTGANAGTGNFGTWPLYLGSRGGSGLYFNGRIYELIVRGAASSTTEIADAELWVNARTGGF